jgi:hypothetical protein
MVQRTSNSVGPVGCEDSLPLSVTGGEDTPCRLSRPKLWEMCFRTAAIHLRSSIALPVQRPQSIRLGCSLGSGVNTGSLPSDLCKAGFCHDRRRRPITKSFLDGGPINRRLTLLVAPIKFI